MPDTNPGRTNPMPAAQASTIPNPFGAADGGTDLMVEATPDMRQAVFADIATVRTNGANSMIDFVLVDAASESGASGVLASRVVLPNEAVINLRDTLVNLTKDWRVIQ